jgi:hypothetical protein
MTQKNFASKWQINPQQSTQTLPDLNLLKNSRSTDKIKGSILNASPETKVTNLNIIQIN